MQTASEESYRDSTNLQSKLQLHQAFDAELAANQDRVNLVQMVTEHTHSQYIKLMNFKISQEISC